MHPGQHDARRGERLDVGGTVPHQQRVPLREGAVQHAQQAGDALGLLLDDDGADGRQRLDRRQAAARGVDPVHERGCVVVRERRGDGDGPQELGLAAA